ncbi:hypothetical protein ABT115_08815 [Streptomyces sp. NPDC001832]|uniref:hypothetical protein n=1 Tax=Streptomyces sp. NPDC001832 TaxID=3154527 RepID=UPI003318C35B
MLDMFWKFIDMQLKELESAKSADDVIRILGKSESGCGDAFFAGSGGDGSVSGSLREAGWSYMWVDWDHYYAMKAPDGSVITYVEGDVYRGNRR